MGIFRKIVISGRSRIWSGNGSDISWSRILHRTQCKITPNLVISSIVNSKPSFLRFRSDHREIYFLFNTYISLKSCDQSEKKCSLRLQILIPIPGLNIICQSLSLSLSLYLSLSLSFFLYIYVFLSIYHSYFFFSPLLHSLSYYTSNFYYYTSKTPKYIITK